MQEEKTKIIDDASDLTPEEMVTLNKMLKEVETKKMSAQEIIDWALNK